jgi:nucleotide-binding universal stress UspA family protein
LSAAEQGTDSVKELIVGFDGSDQSGFALQWAAELAVTTGARLAVVEAWTEGDPARAEETGERVKRELADTAGGLLGDSAAKLDINFEAPRGPAVGALLERVTSESALVLGSRGRGGFMGLLLGSVSRECIEYSASPVIALRHEPQSPQPAAPILVGHDGSSSAARALEWAVELGQATGAEVIAAHVWQTASSEVRPRLHKRLRSAARESLEEWAQDGGSAVRPHDVEGEPRMELVDLAQRLGVGLLVVGRRGQATVRALRMGSVTSYLVTHSPVPIAVIPPAPGADSS